MTNPVLEKLLEQCKNIVKDEYVDVEGVVLERMDYIQIKLNPDIGCPARLHRFCRIELREYDDVEEAKLLILHELLHVLFTPQKLSDKLEIRFNGGPTRQLQTVYDAYIDSQLRRFDYSFSESVWGELNKSRPPREYFSRFPGPTKTKLVDLLDASGAGKTKINIEPKIKEVFEDITVKEYFSPSQN